MVVHATDARARKVCDCEAGRSDGSVRAIWEDRFQRDIPSCADLRFASAAAQLLCGWPPGVDRVGDRVGLWVADQG